ncbi:YacP-like NYN domain protein [Anoxybacillus sp. BCO1]|nr:YacP-like NYN domain protein [Anoxybacillus sp. BCO1]
MEVIFTKENETADEHIEKLAKSLQKVRTKVYVATSDYTEQWAIFGQGALRKSARELLIEVDAVQRNISSNVKHIQQKKRYQKFL